MDFIKSFDISESIQQMVERQIDEIVKSDATIGIMVGYYLAQRELIESAFKQAENDIERVGKMLGNINPFYSDLFESDVFFNDAPLILMRDFLEAFVRQRILPDRDNIAYSVIERTLDEYDWCCAAMDIPYDIYDEKRMEE